MKLDLLKSSSSPQQAADQKELAACTQLTEDAIKEVRTISYLLYPPMLEEMGLKSAVPWYLDGFTKRSGIRTSFEISPDFGRLESDLELAFFRVLQESLTNVHRHSESPTASVRLLVSGNDAILEVKRSGQRHESRGSRGTRPGLDRRPRRWTPRNERAHPTVGRKAGIEFRQKRDYGHCDRPARESRRGRSSISVAFDL